VTTAHIGGVPIEEGVAALAPAGAALLYMATGMLARLRRRIITASRRAPPFPPPSGRRR
jgi:hypothetical protein